MVLFSLVATHTDLDLETVGTLSAGAADVAASVDLPAVTLATCNRLEIYAESGSDSPEALEEGRSALLSAVAESSGLDHETVARSFKTLVDDEAAHHLFEVGAGLDSAVVGEREIAGQVRRSLSEAQAAGTASGTLTKLFESATRAAKEVGTKTALGSRGRSIVSVALDIAGDMRGHGPSFYRDARVVLIGTGAYAGAALSQLAERAVPDIAVFSGSGRAEDFLSARRDALLARGGHARSLRMDELAGAFREADVIIGCSGGNRQISAGEIRSLAALHERAEPLTVIDLALSHDFTPEVAQLPGVDLITLESVKAAAPEETSASVEDARTVVSESVRQYLAERAERTADDAIVTLRKHVQSMLDEEMAKVRRQHGCTAAAEEVEFGLRRMVRKLLHAPSVRAKELAAEGRADEYAAALQTIFGVDVAAAEDVGREAAPRRRRPEEFSAAELAYMAAYLEQIPDGGFCRHHRAGEFSIARLEVTESIRRSA
ncbi:glutamyl-tRNA reductase [Nesterenkonia natronophila]|uniref:Glutamyl-tRNA reductase n=1 Tax=Nesterenkonia natronophila TaxID=2174932 RepID=A0A3A4G167_9MICC|nr:glutamyl-tRNA reductase [Nesterenkonia natronophila]RJN31759.1 glutamyl-tRNA reductase [Nesterenkonia natronophila]